MILFFAKVIIVGYPCKESCYKGTKLQILLRHLIITSLYLPILFQVGYTQLTYSDYRDSDDLNRKTEIEIFLWNEYLRNNIDSLRIIGTDLLEQGTEENNEFAIAVARRSLGDYLIRKGGVESGLDQLKEAASYFLIRGDYLLYSETLTSIGHAYYLSGDFPDAKRSFLNAISAGKRSGDPTAWFASEINLGKTLCALGDTIAGIKYILHFKDEALKLHKYEAVADAYGYLASIELSRDKIKLSEEYLIKSIDFAKMTSSLNHLSHSLNNSAIYHFYQGETEVALNEFRLSLLHRRKTGNAKLIAESYQNIGYFFEDLGQVDSAYYYYNESLRTALESDLYPDAADAVEGMIAVNRNPNHLGELYELKDSLLLEMEEVSRKNNDILDFILTSYEVQNKEIGEEKRSGWIVVIIPLVVLIVLYLLLTLVKSN